jgi:hypothetical protein
MREEKDNKREMVKEKAEGMREERERERGRETDKRE